jgi:Mg2+-importing ATPase
MSCMNLLKENPRVHRDRKRNHQSNLSFLPLLPSQILLTNLLTDFPEMTIATDRVDQAMVNQPRRMNIAFIRNFMLVFGLLSSVFDYLTFGALLLLHADTAQFRTGWFVESVISASLISASLISASLIVLVIRTRQSILTSKPGKYLLAATIAIAVVTLLIPYTPLAGWLGFQALPIGFLLVIAAIVGLYILSAETVKHVFYQHVRS